jgi:hypothetical protein
MKKEFPPELVANGRCGTCEYWDEPSLSCRVDSPHALMLLINGQPKVEGVWPLTKEKDWCAHYVLRGEAPHVHCEGCKWFEPLRDSCREKSPKVAGFPKGDGSIMFLSFWAKTSRTEWCGKAAPELTRTTGKETVQ